MPNTASASVLPCTWAMPQSSRVIVTACASRCQACKVCRGRRRCVNKAGGERQRERDGTAGKRQGLLHGRPGFAVRSGPKSRGMTSTRCRALAGNPRAPPIARRQPYRFDHLVTPGSRAWQRAGSRAVVAPNRRRPATCPSRGVAGLHAAADPVGCADQREGLAAHWSLGQAKSTSAPPPTVRRIFFRSSTVVPSFSSVTL